jgi:hypothetical protein
VPVIEQEIEMRVSTESLAITSVVVVYLCVTLGTFNFGYIDFGDGNYLYISKRMTEGVVLYRDIVSPQPPIHLLIGSTLIRISRWLDFSIQRELWLVRLYLALLHTLTFFVLWRISRHLFQDPAVRILGIALFALMPNTYLWTRAFQSENHEIVFLYGAFLFLLWENRTGLVLAGLASVLGIFTNMTFAPYLALFIVWGIIRYRKGSVWFVIPLIAGMGALFAIFHTVSDGHYIENVFSNQVGTFPKENLARYVTRKLLEEGGQLLLVEGGFIIPALFSLIVLAGKHGEKPVKAFILWFALFAMGSIVFVAKGGTMEYIFVLGEPMVALLAAHFFYTVVVGSGFDLRWSSVSRGRGLYVLRVLVGVFAVTTMFCQSINHLRRSLVQETYEAPDWQAEKVVQLIERYTDPGDLILAPPYYAYRSGRNLSGECSSTYMWYIRYMHAWKYAYTDPLLNAQIERMVNEIDSGRVTLALLNSRQLGQIPELRQAVEKNLRKYRPQPIQSYNEILEIFVRPDRMVSQ